MFVQLTKDFQGQKAGTRIDVTELDAKPRLDAGLAARIEGDQLAPLIQKPKEGMLESLPTSSNSVPNESLLHPFTKTASSSKTRPCRRADWH
jgi:hypothetical protein